MKRKLIFICLIIGLLFQFAGCSKIADSGLIDNTSRLYTSEKLLPVAMGKEIDGEIIPLCTVYVEGDGSINGEAINCSTGEKFSISSKYKYAKDAKLDDCVTELFQVIHSNNEYTFQLVEMKNYDFEEARKAGWNCIEDNGISIAVLNMVGPLNNSEAIHKGVHADGTYAYVKLDDNYYLYIEIYGTISSLFTGEEIAEELSKLITLN